MSILEYISKIQNHKDPSFISWFIRASLSTLTRDGMANATNTDIHASPKRVRDF